ncbi:short chain oxidoreductase/dehydrogenase, putative [Talaromyces stipitatus ATCC 10500]|uniref:Short chain oxidoreductase/dehydrogenase, putative n=1 Tax=Talaromyces stipitatus (strain ATCC 10500 / CBS 375.48 / QM 6759 / NRRL 1006) TaxID=441959 RepID=B8MGX3_TALSN|nr:short chain oxidoreductase/dehydrogenase, putative [Talaromyces stipitatus ATCC 10500]EED16354.1 short chain oxidoreductase/dehydrogenase, putative [Talaromyces stipitatus ATCC 10500]
MPILNWLITGASNGLGLALALEVLKAGHKVIATARNVTKASAAHPEIEQLGGSWLQLDVNKSDTKLIVESAVCDLFGGRIDVLANNAGYSILGSIEDLSEKEIEDQFNTNLYGPIRTIKAALPSMRAQRSGVIVNVSSIAALDPRPSGGIYGASKSSLENLSEALCLELAPFNIRVLIVIPGGFRTDFLSGNLEPEAPMTKDYEGTPLHATLNSFRAYNGNQPGDPAKGMRRVVEVVEGTGLGEGKQGLLRLPLGADCLERAYSKVSALQRDLDGFDSIARSTNLD